MDCRVDGGNHPRRRLVVAEHLPTETSKSTVPHDVPRVFNHQNLVFIWKIWASKMPILCKICKQSQAIWSHLQRDCHGTTTQVHKWNKRSFRNCSCNKHRSMYVTFLFNLCLAEIILTSKTLSWFLNLVA